jgi:outer membrane protein assembly factor BamB
MNIQKKFGTGVIAILILSAIIPLAIQPSNAADTKSTYAYVGAMPNPIGKGQTLLLSVGITDALQKDGDGWQGLTITVTKPDNTTETLGPIKTDSTGSTGVTYIPTMTGTYYFQSHFPAQWYNYSGYNYYAGRVITSETYYKASDSAKLTVTVTEEPVPYYPGASLPSEYWTRPINSQLREWYSISGNWLQSNSVLPTDNLYAADNSDAPESAHVLWTRPIGDTMGGLAGGVDQTGYGTGDAYEGKYNGDIIIGGILYYNKFDSNQPQQEVVAVNLHTGEELWTKSLGNARISLGQVVRVSTLNYQGDFSYIYTTTGGGYSMTPESWQAYEALTGYWKYNLTNVPSGNNYFGPNGEILRYSVNTQTNRLLQWNSTAAMIGGKTGMSDAWGSQVSGKAVNALTSGYDINVSVPAGLTGSVFMANPLDRIVGGSVNQKGVTIWALSLKDGQEGNLLYSKTWSAPSTWAEGNLTVSWKMGSLTDNVGVVWANELQQYYGFSLATGEYLWGPTASQEFLSVFDLITTVNYGCVISTGCSGVTYCYNATTGALKWTYTAEDPYTEFTIGNNWWMQQLFVTDGKVYIGQVEHSGNQPLPRGAPFVCIDVQTGDVVWKMTGGFRQTCWGGHAIIGDSIIAFQDTYEQRVYAVGRGPSKATVTASPKSSEYGTSVIVEGSITDISPGTEEYAIAARFPNGVPCVSEASESEWMKYVYMQFERPTNATGVPITISVLDANGNYRNIGTTTSDSDGYFSYSWIPDIEGKYTIYATFEGNAAYYASHAVTGIVVDPAEATPTAQPLQAESVADTYFLPVSAGLFVTIIVVAVLMVMMLRKSQKQ